MTTGIPFIVHARTRPRAVALAAGIALAAGALAPVPTTSAAATGDIAGVVTGQDDTPLAGIVVTVLDQNIAIGDVEVGQTTTNSDGEYLISGLEADPYLRVRFADPDGDWATEYYDDSIVPSGGGAPYAKWVRVVAGETTGGIDAEMEPGGSISGEVRVGAGTPVEDGNVTLWWQYAAAGWARVGDYAIEDGGYSIPGVKAATYALQFRDRASGASSTWKHSSTLLGSTPVVVEAGEDRAGIDALLGGVVKNTATPVVTGTPQVGSTLTATSGWSPSDTSVAYRWVIGGDATPGDDPTGATYVPTAADLGKTITVVATGTRGAGWIPASATSAATAPVAAAPVPPVAPTPVLASNRAPKVKGKLRVGKTLRVTKGSWTPYPQDVTYTWYASGKVIKGAKRQWFTLTKKQRGKRITVAVTASAPGHQPLTVVTERTDKVTR